MDLPNQVCLLSAIFLVIFSLSSLSTSVILPNANVPLLKVKIPRPVPSSKLVGKFCNDESIGNHSFWLKALSTPEAVVAKDSTQLGILITKLGATNAKATLNIYNEMIKKPKLVEDPQTTNYDVTVIDPKITNCEKEQFDVKVQASRILAGNRLMHYYIAMGFQITSILQLEKPNDY
ncbi:hypothetical protein Golax_023253 [Gossypium laxum]|uniref:Uncharacterized protein n=1 Tax=Gossypium laxum TaxID=34288 RepID=A0A7J9B1H6_9ROSI|nr:hypothetical protein [Gossypium laxum]